MSVWDECGRPVRFVVRPGKERNSNAGPFWVYLTPHRISLLPEVYLYHRPTDQDGCWEREHPEWRARVFGEEPGIGDRLREPWTRRSLEAWVEARLRSLGVEVVSAEEAELRAECFGVDWFLRVQPASDFWGRESAVGDGA